jgi:hypothetical protein
MENESQRREGSSAIGHAAISGFRRAKRLFIHVFIDMFAIAILASLMGDTNDAAFFAVAIVVGAEIALRRFEKRRGQFGQTARGTEVQDHTQEGGQ